MNKFVVKPEFREWIDGLSKAYRSAQLKAAVSVNAELIRFYFFLGEAIHQNKFQNEYGSSFFHLMSEELSRSLPGVKGLSPQNLRYAEKFFALYSDEIKNFPQAVGELFSIPWGHHRTIIDKCKSFDEAFFYVRKTLNENWSRSTLENHLASGLYRKKGAALTNFASLSPLPNGPLAQEITKDPYDFDFLAIRPEYDEKELKDALVSDIQRFLLELGSGFAFVGRETRMLVGESELYDDLLFYHTKLHCYVVVEVKTRKFQPSDLGQLSGYVAAVNHQQKTEGDGPTIGLLICKGKDEVLVKYCLENYSVPLGVSEYDLSHFIESEFKGSMPTIEEIEAGVRGNGKK